MDVDDPSGFQSWIVHRTIVAKKVDLLRREAYRIVLPVIDEWVAHRQVCDPVTGRIVFSKSIVEGSPSSANASATELPDAKLLAAVEIVSFSGTTFSITFPADEPTITVSGSRKANQFRTLEHDHGETYFTDVSGRKTGLLQLLHEYEMSALRTP